MLDAGDIVTYRHATGTEPRSFPLTLIEAPDLRVTMWHGAQATPTFGKRGRPLLKVSLRCAEEGPTVAITLRHPSHLSPRRGFWTPPRPQLGGVRDSHWGSLATICSACLPARKTCPQGRPRSFARVWPPSRTPMTTSSEMEVALRSSRTRTTVPSRMSRTIGSPSARGETAAW